MRRGGFSVSARFFVMFLAGAFDRTPRALFPTRKDHFPQSIFTKTSLFDARFSAKCDVSFTFIGFCELYVLDFLIYGDEDAVGDIFVFIEVNEGYTGGFHHAEGGGVSVIGGRACTGEARADIFAPDDGICHFAAILEGDLIIADMEILGFDPIAAIKGDMGHIEIAGMLDGEAGLLEFFAIKILEHPFCASKAVLDLFAVIVIFAP